MGVGRGCVACMMGRESTRSVLCVDWDGLDFEG